MKRLQKTNSSDELKLERQQVKELKEVSFWMVINTIATILGAVSATVFALLEILRQ